MAEEIVTFERSRGERVIVDGEGKGQVTSLNVRSDGARLFYVKWADADGFPAGEGWREAGQLTDPA